MSEGTGEAQSGENGFLKFYWTVASAFETPLGLTR